jgi:hypothetical protein
MSQPWHLLWLLFGADLALLMSAINLVIVSTVDDNAFVVIIAFVVVIGHHHHFVSLSSLVHPTSLLPYQFLTVFPLLVSFFQTM